MSSLFSLQDSYLTILDKSREPVKKSNGFHCFLYDIFRRIMCYVKKLIPSVKTLIKGLKQSLESYRFCPPLLFDMMPELVSSHHSLYLYLSGKRGKS